MRNFLIKHLIGRHKSPLTDALGYQVFTRKFDVTANAEHLDAILGKDLAVRAATDAAWHELQFGMSGQITKLNIEAIERGARIRLLTTEQLRHDTVATILVDQSGSMRGQRMISVAASVDVARSFLRELGIAVEVLGFTTVRWRGGRSRKLWKLFGRPKRPGRLCDILHVIYRAADDTRASTESWGVRQMLRPDLPKENVDGEALEWAASRLKARHEHRKIIVVVSDGAPVDDSTLSANSLDYLQQHLQQVIKALELDGIYLASVEIGDAVQQYYPVTFKTEAPDQVGSALLSVLEQALTIHAS